MMNQCSPQALNIQVSIGRHPRERPKNEPLVRFTMDDNSCDMHFQRVSEQRFDILWRSPIGEPWYMVLSRIHLIDDERHLQGVL